MSNTNKNTFWQNLWNPPIRVPTKRKKKKGEDETSSSSPFSSVRSPPKEEQEKEKKKAPLKRIPSQDAVLTLSPAPKPANIWSWIPVLSRKPTGTGQTQPKLPDPPKATHTLPASPDPLKATETVTLFPDTLKTTKTRLSSPDPPKATKSRPPSLDPPKATKTRPPPSPDPSKTTANVAKDTYSTPFKDKPNAFKNVPRKAHISTGKQASRECEPRHYIAPFDQFLLKMKEHFKRDRSQPTPAPQNTPASTPQTFTPKTPPPRGAATAKKSYLNRKVQFWTDPETHNVPNDQGKPLARQASRGNFNPWRKYLAVAEIHKRGGYILGPGNMMKYIAPGTPPPPPPKTPDTDAKADEKPDEYTDATERDEDTQLLVTSDRQPKKDTVIPRKVLSEATPIKRKKDKKKKKDSKRKVKSKSMREMRTPAVKMGAEAVKTDRAAVKIGKPMVKTDRAAVKMGKSAVKTGTAEVKTDTPVAAPPAPQKGTVEPLVEDGTLDTRRDVMTDIMAPTVCEEPKQQPKKVMPTSGKKKKKTKSKTSDDFDYY